MKQIVLAKGICTPSYLSKIERNLIAPSEDVAELLLLRLGMDPESFNSPAAQGNEERFYKTMMDSYRNVIVKRDKAYTEQQLHILIEENALSYDDSVYYTYLLIIFRFRLIVGGDLEERRKELDALEELADYFDEFQVYLFNVNKGLFFYVSNFSVKSIESFETAYLLLEDLGVDEWEIAEFHYMLGVAYAADDRTLHSIEHVRKALSYFSGQFQMKRVMDCYIIMGVNQKQSTNYEAALESYLKAKQICEEFRLSQNMGIILHNIGSLYSFMGENQKAIKFFNESLNDKYESKKEQLLTMLCIAMVHSKVKDHERVLEWCDKGIQLYKNLKDESLASYFHELTFLQSLNSEQGLDEKIAKTAIAYFKEKQNYQLVSKYCIAFGKWYFSMNKYKLSALLYEEAHNYGNIYKNITEWEDM
ncbi:tetratricopeptide repeat protein [Sporosarcina sp. Sa2YVA2]|uniref:Tetratricopeptide repeat protein n=2 Tax=Sporosarcina quadrami TaxID=2762234 RepID=A0ABR8UAM9_9BACL|nr:tetratricopeptide repeat protein [Sporosarcina quadrami]